MRSPSPHHEDEEHDQDADLPESQQETMALFRQVQEATENKDVKAAEIAMMKVLAHAADKADPEDSPWLAALQKAHECETDFDWQGAVAAYQQALDVTQDKPSFQWKSYGSLASLYDLLGHEAEAKEAVLSATKAARQQSLSIILAMALRGEAAIHLEAQDFSQAWDVLQELFALLEKESCGEVVDSLSKILRARYWVAMQELDKAEADLGEVWPNLEPWGETFFAGGWQNCFANWWAATAQVRDQHGDKEGAVEAHREVVRRRRIIAQLPQLEGPYKHNWLAITLRNLGRALRETDDPLAAHALTESRSIRESIGLLPLSD